MMRKRDIQVGEVYALRTWVDSRAQVHPADQPAKVVGLQVDASMARYQQGTTQVAVQMLEPARGYPHPDTVFAAEMYSFYQTWSWRQQWIRNKQISMQMDRKRLAPLQQRIARAGRGTPELELFAWDAKEPCPCLVLDPVQLLSFVWRSNRMVEASDTYLQAMQNRASTALMHIEARGASSLASEICQRRVQLGMPQLRRHPSVLGSYLLNELEAQQLIRSIDCKAETPSKPTAGSRLRQSL